MEKIQMTKEQAYELFYTLPFKGFDNYSFFDFKTCLMANGFMGRSDLEKAEEVYRDSHQYVNKKTVVDVDIADNLIRELYEKIKLLES